MATAIEQDAVVKWLCGPEAYSPRPNRVEHVETHISHVFLAGEYAYKLKKPVKFDFLDFSTVEAREQACREEVRLNRRLAVDVYLGVKAVIRGGEGAYQWEREGEIVDWVVEMRRLPTERTLETLYRRGKLAAEDIDRLAATLVRFYSSLTPVAVTPQEYCAQCVGHVRDNLRELLAVRHHLPRGVVERVHGFQLQVLRLRAAMLEKRVREGRIVDGHGDLRPEHICFSEAVAIFDCIEFSAEFRRVDVADELAFLTEECDFLGADWVGPRLLEAYSKQSGDQPAAVLLDFYKSYRACVRAKVSALRADQLEGEAQEEAVREAEKHLRLADRYAAGWLRPLVFVVGGVAGTGKTTLAAALAGELGCELLRTDVIRQEMFGAGGSAAAGDSDLYSAESRTLVYDDMFRRAAALHSDRISVVLDGSFGMRDVLEKARRLAVAPSSVFLAIECVCRAEVARERIAKRLIKGQDASEAKPEIHDVQRADWEPWPADFEQVQIDTEQSMERQVEQVMDVLVRCFREKM